MEIPDAAGFKALWVKNIATPKKRKTSNNQHLYIYSFLQNMGCIDMAATNIDISSSRAEKSININEIIGRMRSYRTKLGFFVDREAEAREILGLGRAIGDGEITILYSPKGCGKATLFLALANTLTSFRVRSMEIHYIGIGKQGEK
ncbi:MAG: hypothetical protein RQ885_09715 [Desulfurococcales archaeon]|nr:hypothetical protein [Desulfurococcales archaeon]